MASKPLSALVANRQACAPAPSEIETAAQTCLYCLARIHADVGYQIEGIAARAQMYGLPALVEAMGDEGKAFTDALAGMEAAWSAMTDEPWPSMEKTEAVEVSAPTEGIE
jgi:hypothetical protein